MKLFVVLISLLQMVFFENGLLSQTENENIGEPSLFHEDQELHRPCLVFLYGPPGSGRSKVAIKIQQNFSIPYISFAELINEYAHEASSLGHSLHDYLKEGGEIPLDLFITIFKKRLSEKDCSQGCLIEGAPWTLQQAHALYDSLQDSFSFLAINIDAQDQWLVTKAEKRLVCTNCGRVYGDPAQQPRKQGTCDTCSGALIRRHEDSPEILKSKLATYRTTVVPVLAFFEEKKSLVLVEGDKTFDSIYFQVSSCLNQRTSWK